MPSWLRTTIVLWCLAVITAIGGAVAAGPNEQLAQDLFLAAAGVGVIVGVLLAVATVSDARARRAARRRPAESPFSRLEYVPAVTTPARRLRWKGSPYWRIGIPSATDVAAEVVERELIGLGRSSAKRHSSASVHASSDSL